MAISNNYILNIASNSDSFSFIQSTTQESSSNLTRVKRSPVWEYCRTAKEEDDENPKFLYCTLCDPNGPEKLYGSNISSNMRAHLQIAHKIAVENVIGKIQVDTVRQLDQLYLQAKAAGQTETIDTQVLQLALNQTVIDEALLTLIVVRNLLFSLVEWPEFHTLCQALNS